MVSDGETSRFVAFTGIISEALYADPRAACRHAEALAYGVATLSGRIVSPEADGLRMEDEAFEFSLVRAGYAIPDVFAAESTDLTALQAAATEAREAGRGIWAACPPPVETVVSETPAEDDPSPSPDPLVAPGAVSAQTAAIDEKTNPAPVESATKRSPDPSPVTPPAPTGGYSCDGRRTCKAMTSCAEAKYYLANCGAKSMDGDKDGIPCESLCKK